MQSATGQAGAVEGRGKASQRDRAQAVPGPGRSAVRAHTNSLSARDTPGTASTITSHFIDRKSALWTLSKFTLLVSGVPTQTEAPEPLRVTTPRVALTAEEGRAGAEPRA